VDGLDKAVMNMKKGEVALLTVAPEYAFESSESKQDLAVVPPSSTVYYEVELVSFVKVCEQALVHALLWHNPHCKLQGTDTIISKHSMFRTRSRGT